jgi:hypothetical protein
LRTSSMICSSVSMSAFDVEDVLDIARATEGFRRRGACGERFRRRGRRGFGFRGAAAGRLEQLRGAVFGAASREIGRGFGGGTATQRTTPAQSRPHRAR